MLHTVGYEQTVSNAAPTAITPIPDPTVAVIGNDIRVPGALPNIAGVIGMINSAAATLRAQIVTPSLRAVLPLDVSPIVNGLIQGTGYPRMLRLWSSPVPLIGLEPMDLLIQNAAAVLNRGFVWLCDGPVKPTTGKIYSVRWTATASLVTASWVNSGAITFASTLPTGHYQVVGMRSWSANQVAARIFFVGYPWRPGVPAGSAEDNTEDPFFRFGNLGVWGEFDNTVPPTIDFMGITDTAEAGQFDLIKVS